MAASDDRFERLSEAYAQRVRELDDLRQRLDAIAEILEPYSSDDSRTLHLADLKRIFELTRYGA